jgi:hypothetical protein
VYHAGEVQPPPVQPGFTPPPAGSFGAPMPPQAPQPSGEALAALVCGLVSPSCFLLGFAALYFGVKARRMARDEPARYGGDQLALAGMIVGGIFGVGGGLFLLAYLAFFVAMMFGVWAGGAGP